MRALGALALLYMMGWVAIGAQSRNGNDTELLTNAGVVQLVRSGIKPSLIVKMIQRNQSRFDLSTGSMIRLKQQGVPDSVLEAMLSKSSGQDDEISSKARNQKSDVVEGQPSTSKIPNYAWQMHDETDVMSGRTGFAAYLRTPAVAGDSRIGDYEITARCNSETTALKIVFLSKESPELSFQQNAQGLTQISDGLLGSLQLAHMHKFSWTETRIRFDNRQPLTVTSEKAYSNESEVYFLAQQKTPSNGFDAFGIALDSIGPNQPAGLEQTLFGAERVLLESSLNNGTTSIFEIHPQDSVFQAFAARCKALIPPPPAAPSAVHTVPQILAGSRLVFALDEGLNVKGVLAGRPVVGRLTEPLRAPPDARVTLYEIPAGTQIVLSASFVGVTPDQIKHSLASQNLTPVVRLEIDHLVLNGSPLVIKGYPLDRATLLYTEPYVPPPTETTNNPYYHAKGKPPGTADGKKSIVAKAGERMEIRVSQTLIP